MPAFADTFARHPGTPRRPFLPGPRVWSVLGAALLVTVAATGATLAVHRDAEPAAVAAPPSPSAPAIPGRLLVNALTGLCLTAGDRITVQPCDPAAVTQHWDQQKDGTLRTSGLCLGAVGGSTDERAPMQVTACDGGAGQLWQVLASGRLLGRHSTTCLTLKDLGTAAGTPIHTMSCAKTADFNWTWR
ncbi:RICIN domain-containing protein [Catenuloplanes japonicus]|uniref:RICIN domain-containing protein n=1 Tax=Catenuloplanes japonicus TaxID=33876 RepID=UPI000525E72C|nr:RICIN domain-containing protein [Catenuloplanes japonicus]